jgi:hypothetical protein
MANALPVTVMTLHVADLVAPPVLMRAGHRGSNTDGQCCDGGNRQTSNFEDTHSNSPVWDFVCNPANMNRF